MKLGSIVNQAVIDPRKLTEYALNPDNPIGANKALVFERRLGHTKDNYKLLLQEIQSQALAAEATPRERDMHGQRYQTDLKVLGVNGSTATVRTGWLVEPGQDSARLVTLYVR